MLEVLQGADRLRDHLVGGAGVQPGDQAHTARVVLETGVVEADGLGRLAGVRSHGSAHVGTVLAARTGLPCRR